jgi:NADH dehydrogenase
MRVLVTGGTGVVGSAVVTALLQHGHAVNLLSRHADRDAGAWPRGVMPVQGDITDPRAVASATAACDAIVHLVGIVEETPPELTFDRINVAGTENVVRAAEAGGVRRLVYVSSLGCDRGESPYHRSKRDAEEAVTRFPREWVILRPGAVYGPGDEHISVLLKMVRSLPAIPLVGDGNQPFQPVWHEDFAEVVALAVERDDVVGGVYDIAGEEITSQRDLLSRLERLTNRTPVVIPVPEFLAETGLKAAQAVGLDVGINDSQLQMLVEGNVLPPGSNNALSRIFDVTPTPLAEGLRRVADAQPEQLPEGGVGPLKRKRFWADISGGYYDADQLFRYVRAHFGELAPSVMAPGAEPGTSIHIEEGETLTLDLPLRGHAQVRVAEIDERHFTLLTVAGHPLAGAVRFQTEPIGELVRFEVQAYDRAATVMDMLMMRTLGDRLQDAAWQRLVRNVVEASGGQAAEVQRSAETLSPSEAAVVHRWAEELVLMRKRDEHVVESRDQRVESRGQRAEGRELR